MVINHPQLCIILDNTLRKKGYNVSLCDFIRICHKAESNKTSNRLLVKVMNSYVLNNVAKILV